MSANAYNLARRLSARNEPDMLQEDMAEDMKDYTTPPNSPYTKKACFDLLSQVCPDSPLPSDCQRYEDVKVALQRKNSDRANHAIAFAGMHAGEATAAMAARDHGNLHHAQIQRRLTSNSKKKLW